MEITLVILVGLVFTLVGLACVFSVAVGLPGSWILIALAVVIELSDGAYLAPGRGPTFGWWLLGGCAALALVGEGLELLAGALGAKKAGSSRRGAIGALVGGIAGAILGIAIPVPLFGSLIGAVIGTFVGAVAGELTIEGATTHGSLKPATGATIGRVLGTLAKIPIALAIWAALSVAAFWP